MPDPTLLLELRRYRLRPGTRETLAYVFTRELVHTQEAVGLQVLAVFDDRDEPDHFVWLRGFPSRDPDARAAALAAFYGGPAWAAHGETANATMLAFDDVHLLQAPGGGPIELPDLTRPLDVTIEPLDGTPPTGALVTADVPNRFARLPVHTERVAVRLAPGSRLRPR